MHHFFHFGNKINFQTKKTSEKNYSTQYSQVVPHPSTNYANISLTSEIRRDPVWSDVYGRSFLIKVVLMVKTNFYKHWKIPNDFELNNVGGWNSCD